MQVERYEAAPGRVSIVGRIEGSDPGAPSLCLMGHTDVVPVNASGWSEDPFGGEIIGGPDGPEVWGRGAVDMLNLTASMAVTFRSLAESGFRPTGDLIYFGVADEEAGSAYGGQMDGRQSPRRDQRRLRPDRERGASHRACRGAVHQRQHRREGRGMAPSPGDGHAGSRLGAVPTRQRPRQGGRCDPTVARLPTRPSVPRTVGSEGGGARVARRPQGLVARPDRDR